MFTGLRQDERLTVTIDGFIFFTLILGPDARFPISTFYRGENSVTDIGDQMYTNTPNARYVIVFYLYASIQRSSCAASSLCGCANTCIVHIARSIDPLSPTVHQTV